MTVRHAPGVVDTWDSRKRAVGRAIYEARERLGWSQGELARRLTIELGETTVTQSSVSYWEKGRSAPEREKYRALETVLGMAPGTIADVLDGRTDLPSEPALRSKFDRLNDRDRKIIEEMVDRLLGEDE